MSVTKFILVVALSCMHMQTVAQIIREKNISYTSPSSKGFDRNRHALDIYYSHDTSTKKPVFIFIHGGSWGSGNKNTYRLMGKNLARRGFVAVIINYRLAPEVQYQAMALDCAKAVTWVQKNSERFGGNSELITLAGHSAGAHLAAFITMNKVFEKLKANDPVKNLILIDPFGLDMVGYFDQYDNRYSRSLYKVFTRNPEQWKSASPLYSITSTFQTPVRILAGAKTYRIIREQSKVFYDSLQKVSIPSDYHVIPRKKHIGMITQFFRNRSSTFPLITEVNLISPSVNAND